MTEPFVHRSSFVDEGAQVGPGTRIWHFCHVMSTARIGADCNIGQNVFIAANVQIGNNVKIQNNVSIYTGVTLEDDVFLGPSMGFTNVINPRSHVSRKEEYRPTLVRRGASIGANATVVCGVEIGEWAVLGAYTGVHQHARVGESAIVAALSGVTLDAPPFALVAGERATLRGVNVVGLRRRGFSREGTRSSGHPVAV